MMWSKVIRHSFKTQICTRGLSQSIVLLKRASLPSKTPTLNKFTFPVASHTITQISSNLSVYLETSQSVTLNGQLNRKPRIMAKNSFAELRDTNGDTVQLLLSPDVTRPEFFEVLQLSIPEESISVSGRVQIKESKSGDTQWELVVDNYQVLNQSNLDAARLDKLKHSSPQDLPPQFRYLQLRTPYYHKNLRTRSKIANLIRNIFINNHEFMEVETPLLFKSTPEGAREFLVPTRKPNSFYALPQSPQQYKQLLMSSGVSRYFQIAKCFRDEDLRADRQPEFTQVDLEMSYISHSDQVAIVVEDLIYNVWNQIAGLPIYFLNEKGFLQKIDGFSNSNVNFAKLTYRDALIKYGIDKPDLRSNLSFIDLSDYFITKNQDFPVMEACVLKNAFDANEKFKLPKSLVESNNYSRRKPYILAIKNEDDAQNWFKKFVEKNVISQTSSFDEEALKKLLGLQPGDVLAFSDRAELPYENPTPLGKFRTLAMSAFPGKWQRPITNTTGELTDNYDPNQVFVASWVVEFPLFAPVEIGESSANYPTYDYNNFESNHHPFTMVNPQDYEYLETDPLKARGEHYDLVINGVEVGGGSRRIHDPELQKYIFKEILEINNFNELFGHLLHALSMGCPPHAGLALGFDRLCAMVVGSANIRDVIAFPKNQSGVDPIVESPTAVPEKTLKDYFIKSLE